MTTGLWRLTCLMLAAALALPAWPTVAQKGAPTAGQILRKVRTQHERVNDYTTDVNVVANVPGIKVPTMNAKVYFKKPDKMHIESKGFAMLPKDVLSFNMTFFDEEKFDAVLQGEETIAGNRCHKVKLLAKSDTLRIQRAMLLVDAQRWVVLQMSLDPRAGSPVEATLEYATIDNTWLLPSTISFSMNAPMATRRHSTQNSGQQGGTPGTVRVTFSNYVVNKGLSDAIFKEKR